MGVIISNNRQNKVSPIIIILLLTSLKEGDKVYSFEVETFINNKTDKILIDEFTTTDKMKRVGQFVGKLDEKLMIKVERAICYVLDIGSISGGVRFQKEGKLLPKKKIIS